MGGPGEKDRRRAIRFPAHVPAAGLAHDTPEDHPAVGKVINISGAGMFLDLDRKLELGTRLTLVFTLPAGLLGREQESVVWCKARVVRLAESTEEGTRAGALIEDIRFLSD